MKARTLVLLCALVFPLTLGCNSKVPIVTKIDKNIGKYDGLFYALPKTSITVEIPVILYDTSNCLKNFVDYEMFDIKKIVESGKLPYSKIYPENIKVTPISSPDLDNIYHIQLTGELAQDISVNLQYNDKNFFTKAQAGATNKSFDMAVKVFSGIVTVASSALAKSKAPGADNAPAAGDVRKEELYNDANCEKLIEKFDAIRNAKLTLLSGGGGGSGNDINTIKYRQEQMELIENKYLSAIYNGKIQNVNISCTFSENEKVKIYNLGNASTLFSRINNEEEVSQVENIIAADGDKLPLEDGVVKVVFQKNENAFSEKIRELKKSENTENSYYYRIPGSAKVSVYLGRKMLTEKVVSVAQFGIIRSLPGKIKGSSGTLDLGFDEETGAIKSITFNSKAIDPANIQATVDSVAKFINLNQDVELNRLAKERQKYEDLQKIKEAKTALSK